MPSPLAMPSASFGDTFTIIETMRSRIAWVWTRLSSKRNAPMMCFCSTSLWLSKNKRAWVK